MALPGFICIGAQKGGTTWLYQMLAQNPSVWLPPLKEVHFFDIKAATPKAKEAKRAKIMKLAARAAKKGKNKGSIGGDKGEFLKTLAGDDILSEAWYERIFSHPDAKGRVTGEITPAYLSLGEDRIAYMKSLLPDTRMIIMVREPQARALSEIRMSLARWKDTEPTDAIWSEILKGVKNRRRGSYEQSIPRWQAAYPAEQLLIQPFSLLKTDPAGLIRTIETFIGATPFAGYKSLTEQVHQTKKATIPDWVVQEVAEFAKPSQEYLINTFGQDFYEKTK